ncbi:MAG TPA: hypothetical protein VJT67_04485, partial [Longimicrobiaceae bacterium]|nr:hypothetical protein [Longimicrobiaceae bacterium]
VAEVLEEARGNGIVPTFAFLVAPPSHPTGPEFDATVTAAATLQAVDLDAVRVRLNVLAHYPGTSVATTGLRWAADDARAELLLDVSDEVRENPLAGAAPELFPFHNRYVTAGEWRAFISRVFVLYTLVDSRPQSVLDLSGVHAWAPSAVADWLLRELPPLSRIPKELRRRAVVEQFDATFHAPAAPSVSPN